jgi:ribosomal protein S18 acetylase RimI-like enzyme
MLANDLLIRTALREDLDGLAHLIERESARPERHCIHSDFGSRAATLRDMLDLAARGELVFMLAADASAQLVGALGCEMDVAIGRGWLRGPFVATDDAATWEALASALLAALLPRLPPAVRCLDSFLNVANERGTAFYLQHGFQRMREVHVYVTDRDAARPTPTIWAPILQPAQRAQVAGLQTLLFPRAYLTGEMLVEPAADRGVFVVADGETVLGYVCAKAASLEDPHPEGTVEFLGVAPEARGRGLGERLLLTALHWLFDERGQAAVNLTVNDELTNARALYAKAGFRLKYTGVHTRWEQA